MEKAIIDAVTAAVDTAVPTVVNTGLATLIDPAVKEKCKEKLEKMEKSMERKVARNARAARLEARVTAANDMMLERNCSISSMVGPQWKDWLERKNEQEFDKIRHWDSELRQIYKEENEERAGEREEMKAEQMQT